MEGGFKTEDKEKLVKFLNMVGTYAKFTMDVKQLIEFYKLLAWAQQDLLKKVEDSTAEVLSVKQVKKPEQDSE